MNEKKEEKEREQRVMNDSQSQLYSSHSLSCFCLYRTKKSALSEMALLSSATDERTVSSSCFASLTNRVAYPSPLCSSTSKDRSSSEKRPYTFSNSAAALQWAASLTQITRSKDSCFLHTHLLARQLPYRTWLCLGETLPVCQQLASRVKL